MRGHTTLPLFYIFFFIFSDTGRFNRVNNHKQLQIRLLNDIANDFLMNMFISKMEINMRKSWDYLIEYEDIED